LPETVWFKLCGHGWRVQHGIVSFFGLGGRDIPDRLKQAAAIAAVELDTQDAECSGGLTCGLRRMLTERGGQALTRRGITHPEGRDGFRGNAAGAAGRRPKHGETGLVLVGKRGRSAFLPSQCAE